MVRAALEFEWTWTADDLPAFAERVGWHVGGLDQPSPTITTDFDLNRTDAMAFLDDTDDTGGHRPLQQIWCYFTDVVLDDPDAKPLLSNAFDEFAQRVFDLVGQRPNGWWWRDPNRSLRWDLANVVLELSVSDTSADIALVSPAYRAFQDEIDSRIDSEQTPDLDTVWPLN
ncbi:DUF6301 family protein [Nocardia sp. NPDC052001]|uniref:DUF6301 family protein n=1 Tax=Nocardia sp. NPDC052001 TaxID=3154853 RepID=UPI00343B89B5